MDFTTPYTPICISIATYNDHALCTSPPHRNHISHKSPSDHAWGYHYHPHHVSPCPRHITPRCLRLYHHIPHDIPTMPSCVPTWQHDPSYIIQSSHHITTQIRWIVRTMNGVASLFTTPSSERAQLRKIPVIHNTWPRVVWIGAAQNMRTRVKSIYF